MGEVIFSYNQSQTLLKLKAFSRKCPKTILGLPKDTQNSPTSLVQCCVKCEKTMLDSGLERPSKLATNIE